MKFHIFNPENDLALADGNANYFAPSAAMSIAHDLATLPLWFAAPEDTVMLPSLEHTVYHNSMAEHFDIPCAYSSALQSDITEVAPWGWSKQIQRRLQVMGFDEELLPGDKTIDRIRELSNRRTAISILEKLSQRGIDTPSIPCYFTKPEDVADFINSKERCVVKAPWSGSGKGIAWGIGRVEPPMENFYTGIIRRQGGVVCEHFLEKEVEFAMEFRAGANGVSFAGYSLFTSFKGVYSGNILATDSDIEDFIGSYIPKEQLHNVRRELCEILTTLFIPVGYIGFMGIDMMIYNVNGKHRLDPCMELNLRMNMGMVARRIFDTRIAPSAKGVYKVMFFKNKGEALEMHDDYNARYGLRIVDDRIENGYINFNPVTPDTRYVAFAIIGDDAQNVGSLYFNRQE